MTVGMCSQSPANYCATQNHVESEILRQHWNVLKEVQCYYLMFLKLGHKSWVSKMRKRASSWSDR